MVEPRSDIPGVILAGGRSSRMGGGDKCLLDVAGRTLLDHVVDRLRPQLGAIALNANGDPERFERYGLPVVADSVSDLPGPLAGILTALDWAAGQGAERVVTVAADTPFFPADLVVRLEAGTEKAPIALASTPDPARGRIWHPTFGLWSVALRDDLRAALEDGVRKVVMWTDRYGAVDVLFDADPQQDPFFNVNTPDDLNAMRDRLDAVGI